MAFKKNFMPDWSRRIMTLQVAQSPLGTVSMTSRNSVVIRKHYIAIQTLVTTLLRNVMLTVLKGA